ESFLVSAGTLFIIPPGRSCEYATPAGGMWEFYWMHTDGQNISLILDDLLRSRGYLHRLPASRLEEHFKLILNARCGYAQSGLFAAQMVSRIAFDVLYGINEQQLGGGAPDVVSAVVEHIEEHYAEPFALGCLSARHFISREHLIRLFKQRTGTTPGRYYRRYKAMKAAQLLTYTNLPIKEVAAVIGFTSMAAFCTQFKKVYGLSPSEYRHRNKVYQN
ncbi:MAG: AraC family transcriptional regulator, partial [Eubacteriales bacterium]|nr:AraC family transcriptional regulator [Eubacteriales bacterium]